MSVTEAKRGNQTVDRLADGAPPPAETPEISPRFDSQLLATSFEYLELTKFAEDSCKCILVSDALKSLAKNQVRQPKTLPTELSIKVIGLFVPQAAQKSTQTVVSTMTIDLLLCKSRET